MKIKLLNYGGKPWQQINGHYIKGYAFIGNTLLDEHDILSELIESIQNGEINTKLLQLNGNFSVIIRYQGKTYLIADKLKSYPLLYAKIDNEWLISDQSRVVMDEMPEYSPNNNAIMTYLTLGYLHGNQTFLNNCNIVAAGTYALIDGNATVYEYHKHIYEKVSMADEEIMNGCVHSIESAFIRMIISIGDRPIWIPLSGGYDSRLLACLCKKKGAKNVKCFTYGIPESFEVRVSKQVAEVLGYPWHYVEYTKEKFSSLANSQMDEDYIYWAMNLNTTSHIQDFIAFKELREKGIIEDDAVIVPGHSGEILGRDQVPYDLLETDNSVADLIYHKYFHWNTPKKQYDKIILDNLGVALNETMVKNDKSLAIDLFTNWNIQNRQANFIVNAVRVYEYFDVDWRIPLWDDELSRFWFSLTWVKNSDVLLYDKFMFEQYFIPMRVPFYKETNTLTRIASKIKLPFNIKGKVRKEISKLSYFKGRFDYNGFDDRVYHYMSILKDYSSPYVTLKKTNINAVISLYQIYLLEKYFKKKQDIANAHR